MSVSTTQAATGFSTKVQPRHLERLAVVYVRQSSLQQVQHHQESTRAQYGLKDTAARMGWPSARVVVIDEDLGISGASAEGRNGFQRLLAEVALDHVGIILGVEMSRLARSCKDWYQLLELCAAFGTLIGDLDGIYDPGQYNDRLLLGLKGTMSEAELHVLRQRLLQGREQKARRGELVLPVPSGYVRTPGGEVVLDPDEEVRAVVRALFEQFERLGSAHAVLRHFHRHGIRLGMRVCAGPLCGTLQWRRPQASTVVAMLRNPTYAGAYVYGRSVFDPRRQKPGRPGVGRVRVAPEHWLVCRRDVLPAYISWETYQRNLAQLASNQSRIAQKGAIRRGRALLQGLVVCGRCGTRMFTYFGKRVHPRYLCLRERHHHGGPCCQGLMARGLDDEVSRIVLLALQPAGLEVSLRVAEDIERARAELDAQWRRRRERAAYEAERAARQYHAVEPENRLVARSLEAAWEEKLLAQRQVEEESERVLREQPRALTEDEREQIRSLANDLPALWHAPTTTDEDRKAILRQVVERVVVDVQGQSEWVEAVIHWAGGHSTATSFRRTVRRLDQLSTWPDVQERVRAWKAEDLTAREIADRLNAQGWRPPRRTTFTPAVVYAILKRHRPAGERGKRSWTDADLQEHEWWLPALRRALGVSPTRMRKWLLTGHVRARQLGGPQGRWTVWADEPELERLRSLAAPPTRQQTAPTAELRGTPDRTSLAGGAS